MNKDYAHSMQDDIISRQGAINEIKNVFDDVLCCNVSVRKGLPEAARRIEMMPSAEPKHGEWIIHDEVKNIYGGVYIECSECDTTFVTQTLEDERFCRNCGARMNGGEEE